MVQIGQLRRSRVPSFAGEVKPVALALGLAFGLSVGAVPAASAANITVNNLSGTSVAGQCTLVDAVQAANTDLAVQGCAAGSGADTIDFSLNGTIALQNQIDISTDVTISGPGAANLTITVAGALTNRALYIDDSNPTVTISGVTFHGNGASNNYGGAIYNYAGALTVQNCVFSGNVTGANGGAICNGGALTIQSSTFTANAANKGGAIMMYGGSLNVQSSTFSGNVSTSLGGAILMYGAGALTMSSSTMSGNQAQRGGAIYFYNSLASTISDSTISGNSSAGDAGAIGMSTQQLTVNNSTFTGNIAGGSGGVFYLSDSGSSVLTLNSTIAANSVSNGGGETIDIADGGGSTINASNSLIQNASGVTFTVNVANIMGQNPLLGPLANNGGPTLTHALLAGSPAIDTGANPAALTFDQRGTGFARVVNGVADIGAFEIQAAAPPPPSVTINQAAGQTDPTSNSPIVFDVVFSQPVSGFTATDPVLSGTAGATTAIVAGSGAVYTVSVSGMTASGTVIVTIPAGAAINAGSLPNTASTSTDNTVTFALPVAPSVTINQAAAQADPTSNATIVFDVVFSQPVSGFTATDPVLSGTAGATTAIVAGSGAVYTVSVSGMTASGTVTVTIPAGAAINGGSLPNTASTSTDNTVTFNLLAPPPVTQVPVPTLSQWGLAILSSLMAGWAMLTGFGRRRRK